LTPEEIQAQNAVNEKREKTREAKWASRKKSSTGALSEDLVYDSITELRDTAFTMLEMGTEILRDWV